VTLDALDQLELLGRLALAALLGGIMGFEREVRGNPAGLRTVALVALGSALFTEISRLSPEQDRIAAGIVTGVGFLGAGVILREGYSVRGVTTAATIWAAAAVGMAVAMRLPIVAGGTALLVVLLLESRPAIYALTDRLGLGRPRPSEPRDEDDAPRA
jgi:putative Mg2+ transporter-C (MgtC) family protein